MQTFYPRIVPMIDSQLQNEYRKIAPQWEEGKPEILIDYFDNLREHENRHNLGEISKHVNAQNLGLTKIRIFDILWWSYLRAKRLKSEQLRQQRNIKLHSIRW